MNLQPNFKKKWKLKLKGILKIGSGLLAAQLETIDKTGSLADHQKDQLTAR